MISERVKFEFRQIETGLIAFVSDIEKKLQYVMQDLPVFVLQTGDSSYYLNTKFQKIENNEVTEKTPRFVMTFGSFSEDTSENTNAFNRFTYLFENKNYQSDVRRIQLSINVNCTFVSPNFIQALQNLEVLISIFTRENAFTYEYCGNTYEAAYSNDGKEINMPEMDSGTRNATINNNVVLQLQLFSPKINTIREQEKYEITKFGFTGNDGLTETIDLIIDND